jgi:hypothetical protein
MEITELKKNKVVTNTRLEEIDEHRTLILLNKQESKKPIYNYSIFTAVHKLTI